MRWEEREVFSPVFPLQRLLPIPAHIPTGLTLVIIMITLILLLLIIMRWLLFPPHQPHHFWWELDLTRLEGGVLFWRWFAGQPAPKGPGRRPGRTGPGGRGGRCEGPGAPRPAPGRGAGQPGLPWPRPRASRCLQPACARARSGKATAAAAAGRLPRRSLHSPPLLRPGLATQTPPPRAPPPGPGPPAPRLARHSTAQHSKRVQGLPPGHHKALSPRGCAAREGGREQEPRVQEGQGRRFPPAHAQQGGGGCRGSQSPCAHKLACRGGGQEPGYRRDRVGPLLPLADGVQCVPPGDHKAFVPKSRGGGRRDSVRDPFSFPPNPCMHSKGGGAMIPPTHTPRGSQSPCAQKQGRDRVEDPSPRVFFFQLQGRRKGEGEAKAEEK